MRTLVTISYNQGPIRLYWTGWDWESDDAKALAMASHDANCQVDRFAAMQRQAGVPEVEYTLRVVTVKV